MNIQQNLEAIKGFFHLAARSIVTKHITTFNIFMVTFQRLRKMQEGFF